MTFRHNGTTCSRSLRRRTALGSAGCRQDMHDAPRYEAYEASASFADGRASRTPPAGTVARGWLREDEALYTGKVDGQLVDAFPFAIAHDDLKRGQERFNIYCSPCHGRLGDGNGMVVQRGLRQAAVYHNDRLRQETDRLLLRRDHQRLRRDAGLCRAGAGARSLADRRVRARAAVQPERDGRRRAGGQARRAALDAAKPAAGDEAGTRQAPEKH